jgi:PAS domain S-box-containing protein/putative nucleotidyltransferase with HDIG domain
MSTILVVDDYEENRYLLRAMLTASGDEVLEAANGSEALELAHRTRPDLIISDILMPQMDGFALCRECKRDEQLRDIPFVFYTATYTDPRDQALALQLGAARFIVKPIENQELIAILREVLQAHSPGQVAGPPPPLEEETAFYRLYNQALIRKLEDKMLDLEQLSRRLAESDERFRRLAENAPDLIYRYELTPQRGFTYVSPAATVLTGYTPEEHYADPDLGMKLVHPDDRPLMMAAVRGETAPGPPITLRWVRKDGQIIWTEQRDAPVFNQARELIAIEGIVRDVTERKLRESELQAIVSLSAAMRTAPTRAEMLPLIVEQVSHLLECDSILAEIIDPLTNETVAEAADGAWSSFVGSRQPLGTGLNGIILETRLPYHSNNVKDDPRHDAPTYVKANIPACAGVPLIAQDQLIGFLWMGRRTEIPEYEVRLLAAVADIAANAIHRTTLHERTQKDAATLAQAYDTTIEGWSHALDLRDKETEGHTQRVAEITLRLAKAMGIGDAELVHIRRGALLHDIGKMGVPDRILLKPGGLDEDEWVVMRKHPVFAYELLSPIDYLHFALDIPYCHHERWDGMGYPRGLRGDQIPVAARIFAVVDVWDALRSDRPYRPAWNVEKTRAYILENVDKHFDSKVVKAFLAMVDNGELDTKLS